MYGISADNLKHACTVGQVEKENSKKRNSTKQHSGLPAKALPRGMFTVDRDVFLNTRNLYVAATAQRRVLVVGQFSNNSGNDTHIYVELITVENMQNGNMERCFLFVY